MLSFVTFTSFRIKYVPVKMGVREIIIKNKTVICYGSYTAFFTETKYL